MLVRSRSRGEGSSFGILLARFKDAVSRRCELQRLDSREVDAIARELNLSAAELGTLALAPSELLEPLEKRLAHAGLSEEDLATSHGDVLRDLRRVCSRCRAKARCRKDLARERRATPSKYCPNEQTLRALACAARRDATTQIIPFRADRG